MVRAEIVHDPDRLSPWLPQWDELAVERGRPYASPGWVLPWWHHVARPHFELRVVVAHENDELIGVAPFFLERLKPTLACYRLLGSGTTPRGHPIARSGREHEAAEVIARELEGADPQPDLLKLEGIPSSSPWPDLIKDAWPGRKRPWVHQDRRRPAPFVHLAPQGFDAWLSSKSKNFRQQTRRVRRQLDKLGATMRLASSRKELEQDLPRFAALHYARWNWRGGSSFLNHRVEEMLLSVVHRLEPETRLRLWSLELGGEIVSAHLFVAAGGEVSYWLGGFDDKWASYRPALHTLLAAIEHAWRAGDTRVDLGGGHEPYKYRLASGEDTLQRTVIVPPGKRSLRSKARVLVERTLLGSRDRLERRFGKLPGRPNSERHG